MLQNELILVFRELAKLEKLDYVYEPQVITLTWWWSLWGSVTL